MQTLLFIGDSITDTGRREDPAGLGGGYVRIIAQRLEGRARMLNRGVSGDRVRDLRSRWETDCLMPEPDVVSILIGINDVWRGFDSGDPINLEDFRENYHALLTELKARSRARVILLEAFLLPVPEDRRQWRGQVDAVITVTRELALIFSAELLPLDGLLNAHGIRHGLETVCADGVHPTDAGHALIAELWLRQYLS